jgi:hypothetical protein
MSDNKFTFKGVTKEFIAEVKSAMERFNVTPAPVNPAPIQNPAPVTMGEATLKDGTVIKWDGDLPYSVGTPLMVIDPQNPTGFLPAPDGEMELQDGTILVVEGGSVKEIKAVAPPTVAPDMTAQLAEVTKQFSTEKAELEAKLNAEIEANKKAIEGLSKSVSEVFALFVKAMELPTDEPIEKPKKVTASDRKERMLEKLMKK